MKFFKWLFSLFSKKEEKEEVKPISTPSSTIKEEKPQQEVKPVSKYITENDFKELAEQFNIEIAALKAIFKVEAGSKSGFLKEDPNIPVTLEEGHIFYKYLQNKHRNASEIAQKYPTICYKTWTKQYYKTGLNEYKRYLKAAEIDEECAMLATSWGMGQCMGFNYKECGYKSVKEFVNAMYESERNQLLAMCNFIKSNSKMYKALKNKDFNTFASIYNGSGQVEYYASKLKQAYANYSHQYSLTN